MVKGVNKTVIEVNDTGSKLFEKIVFYVTPQYGALTARQLKRAAREFSFSFDESLSASQSLRRRIILKKRRRLITAVVSACAMVVGVSVALIIIL